MSDMTPPRHARFTAARALVAGNPLLVVIAGIGFAVSFQTIAHLATVQHMPGYPVLYPVLIDVGFLAAVIEARHAIEDDRSDIAPRALAWLLGALTIYVNAHGSPAGDWLGLTLHVSGPALWIAFLELTRWRKIRRASGRRERIPVARWLADWPWHTAGMWRRMVVHRVDSYAVACAREEALLLARDLVRASLGRRWRRKAPALLRNHLRTGTLPAGVSEAAASAGYGYAMPSMAEPVSEWITAALTSSAKVAAKVRAEKRVIEASEQAAADAPVKRQTAGRKPVSAREAKRAKVRRLLTDGTPRTVPEVARLAGVSESTVERVKRELPTPLRVAASG